MQTPFWMQLIEDLNSPNVALTVIESTGGLERGVVQSLQRSEFPVSVISPKRARDFAKAAGYLAKTDRIDAQVLAYFGEVILG